MAELTNALIGRILMGVFLDEGSAGFYYENPANDSSDGESFVRGRVSDDSGLVSDDGENDNGRGHDDDDHGYHGSLYYLRGDEGDYCSDDQSDGDWNCRDSVYHLCIYVESDVFHGHNDDDHGNRDSVCLLCDGLGNDKNRGHNVDDRDSRVSDDGGKDNHDEGVGKVRIDHGNCS